MNVDTIESTEHTNTTTTNPEDTNPMININIDMFVSGIKLNANETFRRISGETRYETSYEIADALKKELGVRKFNNIVIASGTNFPDALSGSYFAIQKDAPILLVNENYIDHVVDYIKSNLRASGTVYILGGTAAIPYTLEESLENYNVKRLAGDNRYETNLEILSEVEILDTEIVVCTGFGYADSISASAIGKPILLVGSELTDSQKEFLSRSTYQFTIIGGQAAVNENVEIELKCYGTVERLGGNDRYETSVLVAERFFDNPKSVMLAYSKNFPDGLCGGPLAYASNAPILLISSCHEKAADEYATEYNITNGVVFGGEAIITYDSANIVFTDAVYTGHNYHTTTIDATTGWSGYDYYECSNCGYSYQNNITSQLSSDSWPKGYKDDTCTIVIYREWFEHAYVYAAHLVFSDYTRFGTECANGQYNKGYETTSHAAQRLGAIFAVNGCYSAPKLDYTVVRGGTIWNGSGRNLWIPAIYSYKNGLLLSAWESGGTPGIAGKNVDDLVADGKVTDTFCFGPPGLQNGVITDTATSGSRAQRTFIGTNGNAGDIWVCVSDGRKNDGESSGLLGNQCMRYLVSKGCIFGVNLDGGGSSAMYFDGQVLNSAKDNERAVVDFVYFK